MKKLFVTLLMAGVFCVTSNVQAQGSIFLNNFDSGMGIFDVAPGSPVIHVQILSGTSIGSLTPITILPGGTTSIFDMPSGSHFFDVGYGYSSIPALGTGFFEVLVWVGGSSFATANYWGQSSIWQQQVGDHPTTGAPNPHTLDLPAQIIFPTPEPGTLALAGSGAVALLVFRRRR